MNFLSHNFEKEKSFKKNVFSFISSKKEKILLREKNFFIEKFLQPLKIKLFFHSRSFFCIQKKETEKKTKKTFKSFF
jgi:hypothetical protein